jgi:hypothetical protein
MVCREPQGQDQRPIGTICDASAISEDDSFDSADYVLDRQTGYFVFSTSQWPSLDLNVADVGFPRKYRVPSSALLEPGTIVRLYSVPSDINRNSVEIMVAAYESAPSQLGTLTVDQDLDAALKAEAASIARQLSKEQVKSKAEFWQVVDATSSRVIRSTDNAPAFHPLPLSVPAVALHYESGELWLVRASTTDRLLAVSLGSLGNPYALALLWLAAFVVGSLAINPLAKKLVRTGIVRAMALDDALKTSETDYVEFKQELEKDKGSFLKDVTAFANTRGGTVFVGVVDGTLQIVGINERTPEQQDVLDRGIRDSIRQRIQPSPDVNIDFPTKDDRVLARIFVPASAHRHSFEGRYYVREGTQSRFLVDGEIDKL